MKKVMVAAALFCALQSTAQMEKQNKKIHFGIDAGANYSFLSIDHYDPGTIKKAEFANSAGFGLGLSMEYDIDHHLSVIGHSALAFYGNRVDVLKTDNTREMYEIPPVVELAVHFKYKAKTGSVKPYFIAGPSYKAPLVSGSNSLALFKPGSSFDVGFGAEKAFKNFIVSPEIVYSYGLNDITGIPGVHGTRSQTISLIFNFKK